MFSYILKRLRRAGQKLEEGQGLVEYALILVLVAVVVIITLSLVGAAVREVYGDVLCTMSKNKAAEYGNVASGPGPGAMIYEPDNATAPSCWVWNATTNQYDDAGAP
jgi:pilus assembly protein Flp/PilA